MNVERMTKSYRGAQKRFETYNFIKKSQGYLGPQIPKLEPGQMQSKEFKADDTGHFWVIQTKQDQSHDLVMRGGKKFQDNT